MSVERHTTESGAEIIPLEVERKKRREEKKRQPKKSSKSSKKGNLLDSMIEVATAAEAKERNRETVNRIGSLFRAHKMSGDVNDEQDIFSLFKELPGYYKFARGWFPNRLPKGYQEGQPDLRNLHLNFAEELLERDHLPKIDSRFWYKASKVLGDRSMAESVRSFWDEYEAAVNPRSRPERLAIAKAVGDEVEPKASKRGPGRPPAQPKGGVDSITRSRPLEVSTKMPLTEPEVAEREAPVMHHLPGSPLDRDDSGSKPYVGQAGYERLHQEQHANNPEPQLSKPSLFSRPGDTRRELEAWKTEAPPDSSELPHGWRIEDGKIDLPDGRRIIMDLDSHKLGIIATKKAGHTGELARWSESREENDQLLEHQFPSLGDAAREKIIDQLSKAAFARKMAQIDEWFEQDEFDHPLHVLKVEIGKSAVELAEAQKRAEKLFRAKSTKAAFEAAQSEYFVLQKRYLEALASEYEGQPDTAERDAAMFEQIIGMNQAVEDARAEQMTGIRAGFRKFWEKHPKTRYAVGVALMAASVASTASGFLPGTVASMAIKRAMGVYGTYVGTENMVLGAAGWGDKRKDKKAKRTNVDQLHDLEQRSPARAEQIYNILDHTQDNETRSFVLSHLGVMNEYLAEPTKENELKMFEELVDIQQKKLNNQVKQRRVAKGLGLITSGIVSSIGLIPWHHEVAGSSGASSEIGKAVGRQAQEHVVSPNGTVLSPEQIQQARQVFGSNWTPDQSKAFDAMYSILGDHPSATDIANFNNLFPPT